MTIRPLPILRKRADEACKVLAKILNECPEKIWEHMTLTGQPESEWLIDKEAEEPLEDFVRAFGQLNTAESELLGAAR
jgi:hypothetical protein